jgi:hypothetical protein
MRTWTSYFFYRAQAVKTTWLLRTTVPVVLIVAAALTRGYWIRTIADSLICERSAATPVDALLIENFDVEYPLFEEAARLQQQGAPRILVPVPADPGRDTPNLVSARIVEVLAGVARLRNVEMIPVAESEPIVLNAAYGIRTFLTRERIRSVAVVVPAFRSRRSALVYSRVWGESGIAVACNPVLRNTQPYAWARTWHGRQQVGEQFAKLLYYHFYVLPLAAENPGPSDIVRAPLRR